MGSLFKPDIPAPPPPPPPTLIRDEINRVEQVPVKNPDGSTTYVTRAIPLTAEEQAEKDELSRIMDEALNEIERLSATDFQNDESTQKILNAWEEQRINLLEETTTQRERQEEEILARRGLGDSSAANNLRRQRRLDRQDALAEVQRERELITGDIRTQKLGLQQNLFNLASSQQNAGLARQHQSALQGQSALIANNATNQASINDAFRVQLQQAASATNPLSVFAGAAVPAVGLAVGGALGGRLGSIFTRR